MANKYDRLLLAKNEAVKGTDIVPVPASNALRIRSVTKEVTPTKINREVVKPTMGELPHLIGKKMVVLTIEVEWRTSGTAGTPPDYDPLLRACGNDITNVPATSDTYDPLTDSHEACSIYWYEDGLLWKAIGAEGNCTGSYTMDEIPILTFVMSAPYLEPTTTVYPGGETYQTQAPIAASSADVILEGGGAIKVGSFDFDQGNDVQEHYTTGQHEFTIDARQPTLTLTKDSVSTIADWTALMGATNVTFSYVMDGGAGKKITLTAPVMRRDSIGDGERGARHLREITFSLYESSADDQYQIKYE
jgi:hypothetical protein